MDIFRLLHDNVAITPPKAPRQYLQPPRGTASTIPPVHRVPNEILGITFRYVVSSHSLHYDSHFRFFNSRYQVYDRKHDENPFADCDSRRRLLTAVCRRWRAVAFDHAAIWSFVSLRAGGSSVHWADICLKHSKSVPIDVLMLRQPGWGDDRNIAEKNIESWVPEALLLVAPHSSRLNTLAVGLPSLYGSESVFGHILAAPNVGTVLRIIENMVDLHRFS